MIRAIAIDDEPLALRLLENFCTTVDFLELEKSFTKPNEALKYLKQYPVDLLFLDVEMPSMNGIDLYKDVKQNTLVIFTTAHMEYAVEGFNLNALDYLLKPFSHDRFLVAVNKAKDYFDKHRQTAQSLQDHILIRADYSLIKIELADIVLIESLRDYMKIFLTNGKHILARMTMKSMIEKLPVREFVRVHRSFIIPLSKIKSVRHKTIYIGNHEIPISNSYEENFFQLFGK